MPERIILALLVGVAGFEPTTFPHPCGTRYQARHTPNNISIEISSEV